VQQSNYREINDNQSRLGGVLAPVFRMRGGAAATRAHDGDADLWIAQFAIHRGGGALRPCAWTGCCRFDRRSRGNHNDTSSRDFPGLEREAEILTPYVRLSSLRYGNPHPPRNLPHFCTDLPRRGNPLPDSAESLRSLLYAGEFCLGIIGSACGEFFVRSRPASTGMLRA